MAHSRQQVKDAKAKEGEEFDIIENIQVPSAAAAANEEAKRLHLAPTEFNQLLDKLKIQALSYHYTPIADDKNPFFIIKKNNQFKLVANVITDKNLEEAIRKFFPNPESENYGCQYDKVLIPVIQAEKAHIVLVEIKPKEKKILVHDSQGFSHLFFEGEIKKAVEFLKQFEYQYKAYAKQQKHYECGYFVHAYLKDILFNEGRWLADLHVPAPKRMEYLARHEIISRPPEIKVNYLREYKKLVIKNLKLSATEGRHQDRAKANIKDIKKAASKEEIIEILQAQYDFYEKPVIAPKSPKPQDKKEVTTKEGAGPSPYSLFHYKPPGSPHKKDIHYECIVSALSALMTYPEIKMQQAAAVVKRKNL